MINTTNQEKTKRIARNTSFLYFRMLLIMGVTLYTSRITLEILGFEDFGIYNIVGGIVLMLSFFNGTLTTSTQRFLNEAMVCDDSRYLSKVFSSAVFIHVIIAFIIFVFSETVGLYFVLNKLIIPRDRMNAAMVIYQSSIFIFILKVISTPYNASILANEKMNIYAYISFLEVLLKLILVFLLKYIFLDKLIVYGIFNLVTAILVFVVYLLYSRYAFFECKKLLFTWDKVLIHKMLSFSGWIFAGSTMNMLSTQGINILINIFFGPLLNAARAIAMQVNSAIKGFTENIILAVRPQITKSYLDGNRDYAYKLVFSSSKFSFFLLLCLMLPLVIEAELILKLWLKDVPLYSVIFTQLILLDSLISSLFNPLGIISQSSGKIRLYQIIISILFLFVFIVTYGVFKLGGSVTYCFIISIIISFFGVFARLFVLKITVNFPIKEYIEKVLAPITYVTLFTTIPVVFFKYKISFFSKGLINSFLLMFICICITIIFSWLIGVDKHEKSYIYKYIRRLKNKIL